MQYKLKKVIEKALIYCSKDVVISVNQEFERLTGYTGIELEGKPITEVAELLTKNPQIDLFNIGGKGSCYLFTKESEPREVIINCDKSSNKDEEVYYFAEKPNSWINKNLDLAFAHLSHMNIGWAIFSSSLGILLKANDKFIDVYERNGYEFELAKEMRPRGINNSVCDYMKQITEVLRSGEPTFFDGIKLTSHLGVDTYWNLKFMPIYVSGQVKYIIHTIYEVTDNILYREFLEERSQCLDSIIESMPSGMYVADKDLNVTFLNDKIRNMFYKPEKIKTVYDIFQYAKYKDINGEILTQDEFHVFKVLNGIKLKNYRYTALRPDGTIYYNVNGTPIFDKTGRVEKALIYVRDITDIINNQHQTALEYQYSILTNLAFNFNLSYAKASYPDFIINHCNITAYSNALKINSELESTHSITGKNLFEVFSFSSDEIDLIKLDIENLINNKLCKTYYIKKQIIDGQEAYKKVMYHPIYDLNNRVKEIFFMALDVTDEVKAKNKSEEALKIKDDIFANMSHELKTPLNVIFSTNQLLELYFKNNLIHDNKNKLSHGINLIKQNCYRLTKLINNIVDISKYEKGYLKLKLSNENVVEVIEDIVQSVSDYVKDKGLEIIFDTNVEECVAAIDTIKMERVMLNLISNAIKFTNPGGSIFVNIIDKINTVEISVMDTGIGIDEESQKNIFNRFYQVDKALSRNSEGSGIGLSLVKSIVELHGGKISVKSKLSMGTTFKIELPVKVTQEKAEEEQIKSMNSKIDRINIEFSDIYSI